MSHTIAILWLVAVTALMGGGIIVALKGQPAVTKVCIGIVAATSVATVALYLTTTAILVLTGAIRS